MAILGAIGEHELFENCFRGSKKKKKNSARGYKKGNKMR